MSVYIQNSVLPKCHANYSVSATPPSMIYTLSLHDALPIYQIVARQHADALRGQWKAAVGAVVAIVAHHEIMAGGDGIDRSEEHTSELQSQSNLVCRLLLEKKKLHSGRNHRSTIFKNNGYPG